MKFGVKEQKHSAAADRKKVKDEALKVAVAKARRDRVRRKKLDLQLNQCATTKKELLAGLREARTATAKMAYLTLQLRLWRHQAPSPSSAVPKSSCRDTHKKSGRAGFSVEKIRDGIIRLISQVAKGTVTLTPQTNTGPTDLTYRGEGATGMSRQLADAEQAAWQGEEAIVTLEAKEELRKQNRIKTAKKKKSESRRHKTIRKGKRRNRSSRKRPTWRERREKRMRT